MIPITYVLLNLLAQGQDIAKMTCPDGLELQGKMCVRNVREKAKFHCADGVLFRDQCAFKTVPEEKCPAGSQLIEGVCTVIKPVPKIKKDCPIGFEDTGKGCGKIFPGSVDTICPFGDYDHVTHKCIVEKTLPPQVKTFCPPSTIEDGKGCAMQVPLKTMPICEQGILEGESCTYTNQEAPVEIGEYCPSDSISNGDNCIREIQGHIIETCPEGGEPLYGMCEVLVVKKRSKAYVCPKGFEKDGLQCKQKREGEMIEMCPPGTDPDGESCVRYEKAPKQRSGPFCPDGFEPSEGKDGCYKTEIYDCTPPVEAKDGAMRGSTSQTVAQTCEKKEYTDNYYDFQCPEEFEDVEGSCLKAIQVEKQELCNLNMKSKDLCFDYVYKSPVPRVECEEPYVFKDGKCARKIQVPAKKICEETGSPDIEKCFALQEVETLKERGCPAGYEMKDGICYQVVASQPKMVCEDQNKPLDSCFVNHRVEPVVRAVCPDGSVQDPESHITCVERTSFDPVNVCENGTSLEDCYDTLEIPYGYQCPFGSVERGDSCQKIRAFEKLEMCEDPTAVLVNGSCVKTIPAVSDCPTGTKVIAGYCVGQVVEEPFVEYTRVCIGKGCDGA